MKTSNKLLVTMAALVIIGLLSFNITLKGKLVEYKETHKNMKLVLKPFKYLTLRSKAAIMSMWILPKILSMLC
jgi:hypothetical protein